MCCMTAADCLAPLLDLNCRAQARRRFLCLGLARRNHLAACTFEVRAKLLGQVLVRPRRLGDDDEAGGVAVEPVNYPRPKCARVFGE